MRITKISIEGWRSIKCAEFYPSDITILVGANNAGKTNIMSAINFILGDRWPMPGNLVDTDYFGSNRTNAIIIELSLDHQHYSRISFDTRRDQYILQAFDRRGSVVRGFNNVQREEIAFAYVDASRNFERHFGMSRWSLFGQSIRRLHDGLRSEPDGGISQLRDILAQAHALLRTETYEVFERNLRDAFAAQLRTARYDVRFEFRTIDETNLYRGLYPMLIEAGSAKTPGEVGSGVRNLLVLALFQAFARSFRSGAVLGIEEPELYLHPHAQRSLMRQFDELAQAGNQIFVSSHSAHFLDVTKSERIVLVERCEDDEEDVCTQVRCIQFDDLVKLRRTLHPNRDISEASLRAFLRNVRTPEMTEPFFAHLVLIVEGPSEREAIPVFCSYLGLDFDEYGISIVSANGKTAIDTLAHLYGAHKIRTYIIFDNDNNGRQVEDRQYNCVMCRLVGIDETASPEACVADGYAILAGNWEDQCKSDAAVGADRYDGLVQAARAALGLAGNRGKPLIARYVAEHLVGSGIVPEFMRTIEAKLRERLPEGLHREAV